MKKLTCEMCGSTDLIKDGGVFVCQTCGCKYSVEEARKMMIEGTVDVRGTVQVDNSAFVQKYLENARRAKEKEDWEETEKYYNMVEQNDPNNIEAIFYSAYSKAKNSLIDRDMDKREAVFKVLKNCISIIDDKYQCDDKEQNEIAIKSMAIDLLKLVNSNFVPSENPTMHMIDVHRTFNMFMDLIEEFHETIVNIEDKNSLPYMYNACIELVEGCKKRNFMVSNKERSDKLFDKWLEEQKEGLKQIKRDAYWAEHKEEKERLESEKTALNEQIAGVNKAMENLEEIKVVKELKIQIEALKNEKNALGLFAGKNKKIIQAQIDNLTIEYHDAENKQEKILEPMRMRMTILCEKLAVVNAELKKVR